MSSILSKSVTESAVWVADWVLSCQQIRKPERYTDIFSKFLKVFQGSQVIQDGYPVFLSVLEDVFDILNEGKKKGIIKAGASVVGALGDQRIEIDKTYSDLIGEAEEFFLCLVTFGLTLDSEKYDNTELQGEHVYKLIEKLISLIFYAEENSHDPRNNDLELRKIGFEDFKLKLMMNAFDMLPKTNMYRFPICMKIVDFAIENDLFDKIYPHIYQLEEWISEDKFISFSDRKQIFLAIVSCLRGKTMTESDLLFFLTRIVRDYDQEINSEKLNNSVDICVELLVCSISSMDVVTFDDIIKYKSIQALQNTEHSSLLELIKILVDGDHNSFLKFKSCHPDFFTRYDLSESNCYQKIKLLVLVSMASSSILNSHSRNKISLQELADRLNITLPQAESLAVEAIKRGIVNGQIDQINSEIIVRSSLQRSFGMNEWLKIKKRLVELDSNISEVLSYFQLNDKYITTQ